MTKKLTSLLTVLIVLFGFICCSDPDNTPSGMQVYNSDKTTPYTGADLDFYIKGDTSKTLAATIRSGKLVIRYIPNPTDLTYTSITGATDITPNDLTRAEIILVSMDDSIKPEIRRTSGAGNVSIGYFNKKGSFKIDGYSFSVVEGWNFYYRTAATNPEYFISGKDGNNWCWVLNDTP